jgi:hypothetical protein
VWHASCRVVHELRESGAADSLQAWSSLPAACSRTAQQPQHRALLTKQLSLQHHNSQQHDKQQQQSQQQGQRRGKLQGRFRSATADSMAVGNPVREALDRAFPVSPTTCSAATAARPASASSHDDFRPYGQQWKPSAAVWAATAPAPAQAASAAAQAGHLLSDDGLISRSCSNGGAMHPSTFAPARVAWPARRSRRTGSSSGGSFQISASDAGSMSISAEGSSSGRSSFDRTSSQVLACSCHVSSLVCRGVSNVFDRGASAQIPV